MADLAERLTAAADALEERVDLLPPASDDLDAHHRAVDALQQELVSRGGAPATIRRRGDATEFAMLGLKVTATAGLPQACRNWIRRARSIADA